MLFADMGTKSPQKYFIHSLYVNNLRGAVDVDDDFFVGENDYWVVA